MNKEEKIEKITGLIYSVNKLIVSADLDKEEWEILKKMGLKMYLTQELIDEIEEYFNAESPKLKK